MLEAVLGQLVALIIAAISNILIGVYNNINIENCNFSWQKLLTGVIKAAIIIVAFIGIAYCFDVTDLSAIGATPDLIMNAAIVLYVGKTLQNLAKTLGINMNTITSTNNIQTSTTDIEDIVDDVVDKNNEEEITSINSVG